MKLEIKIINEEDVVYEKEIQLPKEVELNAPVMAMLNPLQLLLSDEAWKITQKFNKWRI